MGASNKKVVWILGAGFSVPLGAPLFRELISAKTLRTLVNWEHYAAQKLQLRPSRDEGKTHSIPAPALSSIVFGLYTAGHGAQLWGDAEQFLDRLEIAATEHTGLLAKDVRKCLRDLAHRPELLQGEASDVMELFQWQLQPEVLHTEAIRYVAGACSAFLVRATENVKVVDLSEQWDPYRRWYDLLQPGNDSVISFNYDCVPELLAAYGKRHGRDLLVTPVEARESFDGLSSHCVPVYQLHGHVGWLRADETTIDLTAGRAAPNGSVAYIHPENAVIGVPGQAKRTMPTGLLKCLWEPAMAAIEVADAVVLVGYRFPETDNMAKRALIGALKKNANAYVHLVLGANNPDTPRVQSMLEWTRPNARVRVHPVRTEDFFPTYERQGLFNG